MQFAFFRKSTYLATFLFFVLLIANQVFVFNRLGLPMDEKAFSGLISGANSALIFPVLLVLVISFVPVRFKSFRKLVASFIFSLCFLPIIDLVFFNATNTRFNWSVWHDLNYYAIKASILEFGANSTQLVSMLAGVFLLITAFFSLRAMQPEEENGIRNASAKALCFLLLVKFFFPMDLYPIENQFAPIFMRAQGQNSHLKVLHAGCLKGFFTSGITAASFGKKLQPYSTAEKAELSGFGLLPDHSIRTSALPHYNRVIMIVFESLALEYLHSFNSALPSETSDFFDALLQNYPSCNEFYTSATPTLQGLYAMLNSRAPFAEQLATIRADKSIVKLFAEKYGAETFFIRGVSKFYGGENLVLKAVMGFENLITFEELAKDYAKPEFSAWGFHDDVVFEATLKTLRQFRNKPLFILAKLIDQHQPPYYCGLPHEKLPESVARHPSPIVRSTYWANHLLKDFFVRLEEEKLLDDKTLLIITSDHYPPPGYGHQDIVASQPLLAPGRIPLILVSNQLASQTLPEPDKLACQLDLAPTICNLTGISQPDYFLGQPITASETTGRAIVFFNDQITIHSNKYNLQLDPRESKQNSSALTKWVHNLFAF